MKINSFDICLHVGHSSKIEETQINVLKPLEEKYDVHWNLRSKRYPHEYPSYSMLVNHAICTSNTEWIILLNDRTIPSVEEVEKMLNLLCNGFSCVFLYNMGFVGFSKELIRNIGFFDERFKKGGWEDRDIVYRICQSDLALYESQESKYNYSEPKSPLQDLNNRCQYSQPHWDIKWKQSYSDAIIKMLPEEEYPHWNLFLGESRPDISDTWKTWKDSVLNIGFDKPNSGPSSSSMINGRRIVDLKDVQHLIKI